MKKVTIRNPLAVHKVVTQDSYYVEEQIIGEDESRLIITTVGEGSADITLRQANIETMQSYDLLLALDKGGLTEIASDEDYINSYEEAKALVFTITNGGDL